MLESEKDMFAIRFIEVAAVLVAAVILLQQVAWPLWKSKPVFPALRAKLKHDSKKS